MSKLSKINCLHKYVHHKQSIPRRPTRTLETAGTQQSAPRAS